MTSQVVGCKLGCFPYHHAFMAIELVFVLCSYPKTDAESWGFAADPHDIVQTELIAQFVEQATRPSHDVGTELGTRLISCYMLSTAFNTL